MNMVSKNEQSNFTIPFEEMVNFILLIMFLIVVVVAIVRFILDARTDMMYNNDSVMSIEELVVADSVKNDGLVTIR